MKRRLLIVVMALLIIVNVFGSSCVNNDQAIRAVATDFMAAYQNQEYSRCLDYLSNHLRRSSGDQQLINRMQLV